MKHLKYTKNILTCLCTDRENVLDHRPADLPSSQTDGTTHFHVSYQILSLMFTGVIILN